MTESRTCGWPWVGESDGAWHRCDLPESHRGLHKEGGRTYLADEVVHRPVGTWDGGW